MGLDPCKFFLKIQDSIETPTPKAGSSFGSVNVHSPTLPRSQDSLLARTLASPCLGCELKARVTTCHAMNYCYGCSIHDINCNCYHFSLKVIWQILLIQHGMCYFCNVPIFPFNNSILLWGITT
jgi:hypothetical protein